MQRLSRPYAILAAVFLLVAGQHGPPTNDAPDAAGDASSAHAKAERVQRLIRGLDDDDYNVRKRSQQELIEIGDPALRAVREATENPSAEVRFRARRILTRIPRLIAYYPFEGTPKDMSGGGNDGVPVGRVEYTAGVVGKAVRLYGIDDRGYIQVANSERLELLESMTVACWYRIEDEAGQEGDNLSGRKIANAHQAIVAKHGDLSGFSVLSLAQHVERRQIVLIANNRGIPRVDARYAPEQPLRQWYHIAVAADDSQVLLYHNGRLVATVEGRIPFENANQRDLFIGIHGYLRQPDFRWYPLNGAIDEVRFYNYKLPGEEIKSLYEREKAGVVEEGEQDDEL